MCYRDFLYQKIKVLQDRSMEIILQKDTLDDPELLSIIRKLDSLINEWMRYRY